jgi:hypothetical protein
MAILPNTSKDKSFPRFQKSVLSQTDPILILLRAHLYSEAAMKNLIQLRLPQGQVVVNKEARLTYSQKLLLVQALGILDPRVIAAFKALNKVRNEFAHDIDREFTFHDVLRIGDSMKEEFEKDRQHHGTDTVGVLRSFLCYICGGLDGAIDLLNELQTQKSTQKD